jgi:hypothetical protein
VSTEPRFTEDKWADHPGLLPALVIRAQGKDGKVLDVLTKVQKHVLSSVDNSDNLYVIAPTGSGRPSPSWRPSAGHARREGGQRHSAEPHESVAEAAHRRDLLSGSVPVITVTDASLSLVSKLNGAKHSLSVATSEKWSNLTCRSCRRSWRSVWGHRPGRG